MSRDVARAPHDPDETRPRLPLWYRAGARIRGLAIPVGLLGIAVSLVGEWALSDAWLPDVLPDVATALLLVGIGLAYLPMAPKLPPRRVAAPVTGRWTALNSPATRIPSHGTHSYGQTFAIDLVAEPEGRPRPNFGEGPGFRPPEEFPAFGQEVLAPADADVVEVRDGARDHRSRSTWGAIAYMLLEGFVRELGGSRYLLGNFVVLDLGDGAYAALVHLQKGSVNVRRGQRIRRGHLVGRCGNSGNSSEPHVHFQLMDHPRLPFSAGVPFVFTGINVEGSTVREGVPGNGQAMQS